MSNNDTVTIPEKLFPRMMVSFGTYFGAGVITFSVNSLFFASIYRHQVLRERKEYIVLSALVLMDLLQGYAFTTSGIARMYYISSGTINHLVTRMGCLAKTWSWVWFPLNDVYGATLLMVSVDRLVSMSFPLDYLSWGRSYALRIITLFYGPYVPVIVYAVYQAQKDDDRAYLSQICFGSMIYKDIKLFRLLKIVQANLSLASFVAYAAVVAMDRLQTKRVMRTLSSRTLRNRLESQRHLMVTLGISCLTTMLLFVSPTLVLSIFGYNSFVVLLVAPCMALNHLVNPLLFFWHHKTIQKAIYCLLTNKQLTQNMIDALFKSQSLSDRFIRVKPMNRT